MRVVIDANIILSGFIWDGKPYAVMGRVIDELDILFVSDDILQELEETVQKPKFDKYKNRTAPVMGIIKKHSSKITVSPEHCADGICRDPDDDKYLECAHAGGADYIITGDGDLLALKEHVNAKIVTPAEYLEIVNS